MRPETAIVIHSFICYQRKLIREEDRYDYRQKNRVRVPFTYDAIKLGVLLLTPLDVGLKMDLMSRGMNSLGKDGTTRIRKQTNTTPGHSLLSAYDCGITEGLPHAEGSSDPLPRASTGVRSAEPEDGAFVKPLTPLI